MIGNTKRWMLALTIGVSAIGSACDARAASPIKEVPAVHYGWEVDEKTRANVCVVSSGDKCEAGRKSSEPGGFENLPDVAVGSAEDGEDVWVDDKPNQRIQEITPAGKFVLMIGRDVNATTGRNICTQAEIEAGDRCNAGLAGSAGGEFDEAGSIVDDPSSHNIYVLDGANRRIQEFTEAGQFVSMFGKEVDATTKGNMCTAISNDVCKQGVSGTEPGSFSFNELSGAQLAFGGPEQLLYVSDTQRIQEFEPGGNFKRQISLETGNPQCATEPCEMRSLAIDKAGNLYVVYAIDHEEPTTVHELGPNGEAIAEISLNARHAPVSAFGVTGVTIESEGRLIVTESETQVGAESRAEYFGALIGEVPGETTEFTVPADNYGGMALNGKDELYLPLVASDFEVLRYRPVHVADVVSGSAGCRQGPEGPESDVTFICALHGEVNPESVPDTGAWFEWGMNSALTEATPVESICTVSCGSTATAVEATITYVPPNETVFYRLAAVDEVIEPPEEPLMSPILTVPTGLAAPRFVGIPSAEFVKRSSAILFGELNPEKAKTRYWFQYAPTATCERLEGCAAALDTPVEESSAYARIGASAEVTGLQPDTGYRYRMIAESENTSKTEQMAVRGAGEQEGVFTTTAPIAVGASTGDVSAVGTTTATISGSIEPDGEPVSYAFELGVTKGAETQYGVVYSGSVQASVGSVEESLSLSGLQFGTTYSYRITASYGSGRSAGWSVTGGVMSFTTLGLSASLVSPSAPPLLAAPQIVFPKAVSSSKPKQTKKHNRKKPGKKKKSEQKRARRDRSAQKDRAGVVARK